MTVAEFCCFYLPNLYFLLISAYGKEGVKMNFVDRIFVGELTNTIMCEECEHVSDSLPVYSVYGYWNLGVCVWSTTEQFGCIP